MREFEIELSIGDTLRLGDHVLTVIDVDLGEISFRVDRIDSEINDESEDQTLNRSLPR